jgi:hypothetical protein
MGYARNPTGGPPTVTDPFVFEDPRGIPQSIFRTTTAGTGGLMFDVPNPAPMPGMDPQLGYPEYQAKEMLAKMFNNFTTRSNVFAVWLTVGFFEVTEETDSSGAPIIPVRLGAEIGKAENRHVRYRMFAIVDRTQMTAFDSGSASLSSKDAMGNPTTLIPDQYVNRVKPPEDADQNPGRPLVLNGWRVDPPTGDSPTKKYYVTDKRTGREWEITDGTILVIDPKGDNEEAVVVKSYVQKDYSTTPPTDVDRKLYANFMRAHGDGAPVICHGNPGPRVRYNPREDTEVVPYFQLLD